MDFTAHDRRLKLAKAIRDKARSTAQSKNPGVGDAKQTGKSYLSDTNRGLSFIPGGDSYSQPK